MTTYDLKIFYYDYCPFCQIVLKTIKQLNIDLEYCDTMANQDFNNKLLEDTGRRTVPCLYINDKPMHESSNIIAWLHKHQNELKKR